MVTSHQCEKGPGSFIIVAVVKEYIRGNDTGNCNLV